MLTVAYCRVSTAEQASDGFSIEGQTEKLRGYAALHDLGDVVVISDLGLSGKDMNRPGLQQLLQMIDDSHVSNVLLWRLDRLSRNVADLSVLADRFITAGIGVHSFTESLDLSSATGKLFFNILASFAQYYREALSENVRMGMSQARLQGRFVSRPAYGYDLADGLLTPNEHAPIVRRVFDLRAQGRSQREISDTTGVAYSTVLAILKNRHYLGEIRHDGDWIPGIHEPIVTVDQFDAAHRGRVPGRRRGKDLMSGRIVCGLCGRRMSVAENGKGQRHYRCKHRGQGCDQPARSNRGLLRSFQLGLDLLRESELRDAIRDLLAERRASGASRRRRPPSGSDQLAKLYEQRRKLLNLYYDDKISADQFGEEQARLTVEIEVHEAEATAAITEQIVNDDLAEQFDRVVALLDELDFDLLWENATHDEQRTLIDELLDNVAVYPDRLVVTLHGAPPLNVAFSEVGLKPPPDSEIDRVGGPT